MFTPEWREKIRAELLDAAKADSRIGGGAITGSATRGQLDSWSDIDLAFGVRQAEDIPNILTAFTEKMYQDYSAVHHLDVHSGGWIYRVFLLASTLQVDLAFVSQQQFRARAPTFQLVFGDAESNAYDKSASLESYVGWCWLYALHTRSSIKRGKLWQAEYFVSGLRNYLISIYCRRYQLPEREGRGVDRLPQAELLKLEATLVKSMAADELRRAFSAVVQLSLDEILLADKALAAQIGPTLQALVES